MWKVVGDEDNATLRFSLFREDEEDMNNWRRVTFQVDEEHKTVLLDSMGE